MNVTPTMNILEQIPVASDHQQLIKAIPKLKVNQAVKQAKLQDQQENKGPKQWLCGAHNASGYGGLRGPALQSFAELRPSFSLQHAVAGSRY